MNVPVAYLELMVYTAYLCVLQALAKTLTTNQLFYVREQFELLSPNKNGYISLQNLKSVSTQDFIYTSL
jgi:Ca2+-binding EF-hand superfamily protein